MFEWFNQPANAPQGGMFGSGAQQQPITNLSVLAAMLQDLGAAYDKRPANALPGVQKEMQRLRDQKQYQDTISGLFGAQNINNVQSTAQMPMAGAGAELANRQYAGAYNQPTYGGAIGGLSGSTQDMLAQMLPTMDPSTGNALLVNSMTAAQERTDKLSDRQAALAAARKPGEAVHEAINPTTGKMGQYRFAADGSVEWLNTGVAPKAPTTRTIRMGTQDITQEFNPLTGQWTQIAKGAAFKPDSNSGPAAPSGYRYGADGRSLEFIPGGPADPNVLKPKKPLPASLQKAESEDIDAIQTARSIKADMGSIKNTITSGALTLGPFANYAGEAMNYAGMSNQNSRNFATFKSSLEKMRNDSLRLNKGVQTEGDAQRAWNELFASINDQNLVVQRLGEIEAINDRAADLKEQQINLRRQNYGLDPFDANQIKPPPAIGQLRNLSAQDRTALEWANKNPTDPRAAKIIEKIKASSGAK